MHQHVPLLVQDLMPYLGSYGYWAVFGAILLEDFGMPARGETMLISGSLLAALGHFNIAWDFLLAFVGAVIGDNIGFAIGRFGGRRAALRFGSYVFLTEKRLGRAERFFDLHGGKVVTVARFIEGFRQLNGIVAGTSGMGWKKFLAFNALGAFLWIGFWGSAAYFLGDRIGGILATFKHYEVYVIVGVGVILVLLLVRFLIRRRHKKQTTDCEA